MPCSDRSDLARNPAEPDVDQDEVGPQRAGLPQRPGDAGGHAYDGDALALQQQAGRLQEGVIIIY
jgi:hypothetical protein